MLIALPSVVVFAIVNYGLLWGVDSFVTPFSGGFLHLLATGGVEEASLLMIAALARAAWAVQPWFILLAAGPLIFFWRLYRTLGRLESANAELVETQGQAIDGLIQALAARDNEVSGHSDRVAYSTSLMARELGVDPASEEYEVIIRGALLHDVGKIGVRDAVLHKPGSLTDDEWIEMRDHAVRGYGLVQAYRFLEDPAQIVLAHHERWDGKGYPRGLAGEAIPLGARIFAVADTFDAITAARPYRPARTRAEAVEEIVRAAAPSSTRAWSKASSPSVNTSLSPFPTLPPFQTPSALPRGGPTPVVTRAGTPWTAPVSPAMPGWRHCPAQGLVAADRSAGACSKT